MAYKIIGDSCLDLTEELKKDSRFQMVPLTLQVDDVTVVDDENFDRLSFIEMVRKSPNYPKSACPSPEAFKLACECEEEDVFIITLSSHLSGTYNSAMLGKQLYEEEHGSKNIFVVDSESASAGELNIALYIAELYEAGASFEEVVEKVQRMRDAQKTFFVIDSLEPLRKNGRLTGLQAFFATALNIKPVMGAEKGVIVKLDQTRGSNKALTRMCELAAKSMEDMSRARCVVAQCNTPERAQYVKKELERLGATDILITETAGVATVYAGDGGIVLGVSQKNEA